MLRRVVLAQAVSVSRARVHARSICQSAVLFNEEKPAAEGAKAAQEKPAESEVEVLKKEIEELKTKTNDLNDRLLRALADAENVRRISRVDVQNAREFAITKFAKSLLDVSDNLQRAHQSIVIEELHPEHTLPAIKSLHEGVVMTDGQLQKVFREFNINPVGEIGDKFDPNVHDALFEYEDKEKTPGSIGQLLKIGYVLNNRVIRPAQVGVVKDTQKLHE
ncbi:TPA: hypothetical protein N0F65_006247 [Lagenidium giganteum]|uniref:GrpE protein homolog n=1 Tax=Lagenidium giganteum TaxID=4803 RepID=A0AAV2Z0X4_9STRA|nr:TPA: hypothetical protein N0F65_006247 [Lagenidium giganteum]